VRGKNTLRLDLKWKRKLQIAIDCNSQFKFKIINL
jgi:hypothetical protein